MTKNNTTSKEVTPQERFYKENKVYNLLYNIGRICEINQQDLQRTEYQIFGTEKHYYDANRLFPPPKYELRNIFGGHPLFKSDDPEAPIFKQFLDMAKQSRIDNLRFLINDIECLLNELKEEYEIVKTS